MKTTKLNALLVYPKYPETFWGFNYALPFVNKKASFPPLGLMTVAAMLPKEWNKRLIDMNVEGDLLEEHIKWADIVLVSAMIVQKKSVKEVIARCKEKNKLVVAGGPLFTAMPEHFKEVDHLILNEAEITLRPFLQDLANNKAEHIYTSEVKPDLYDTPIPLWSLINPDNYMTMAIQFSRGCPHNCKFCDIAATFGRLPRTKTTIQIIEELEALRKIGWRGTVFFADDNIIGYRKNFEGMLPRLIDWQIEHDYPVKLMSQATVLLANDEKLMNLMSQANFFKIFLGLESPSDESLVECNKTQNIKRDLGKVVRTIQAHGMQVLGGHIVGFDSDRENIFNEQFKLIQNNGIVVAMVGLLSAIPNTPLWHELKSKGRLLKEWEGENTDISINFSTVMDVNKLINGYKKLILKIYSAEFYYPRIETFIKNYNHTAKGGLSPDSILVFIKSVWMLGIVSDERMYYWKLFFKTAFTKIKALPEAIELAVMGYHFRKVAERIAKS